MYCCCFCTEPSPIVRNISAVTHLRLNKTSNLNSLFFLNVSICFLFLIISLLLLWLQLMIFRWVECQYNGQTANAEQKRVWTLFDCQCDLRNWLAPFRHAHDMWVHRASSVGYWTKRFKWILGRLFSTSRHYRK